MLQHWFAYRNPYVFVKGASSNGSFLSDEFMGDFFVLKVYQMRTGFVLGLLS